MNEEKEFVRMEIYPGYYGDESFSEIILVGEDMVLPIYVTRWQAESIMNGLEGNAPSRPMTHDIFIKAINLMGGSIKKVVIDELHGGVFMAKMYIEHYRNKKAEEIVMDARPSDCIALAAREGCPIYVAREVLMEAGKDKEGMGIKDF
ncbi:MAG: bifunctional nuclease family protein [Thermoplasmata archaeon]|nr:MAG: bifunctional nuclease family protein [Thermoplasmata archaeon]RLF64823.1 MAG: bifunctional nuclease family protein [Thermoplasmata archaeon]